jgi:serine/threonine protein kinase
VFLVHRKDDESKKLYAMKVLSKEKVMTKNLKRYALTERNVMSVINHPFMVKLNYAFQSSSKLFLVMDYYPGGDLGKLISKKRVVPEEEARKYICELILAFEALHKNMIVFRDLKPDNVVLDWEGHCRLTDFGLSKEGIYNNTTGSFCGSVAYLAPEILTKQGHSRTVDWYLLGLLLYELIVGIPPYYNSKK